MNHPTPKRESKAKGYRPSSLTDRDNYGLSPEQLKAYLERLGVPVPPELRRLVAEGRRYD